MGGHKAYSVHDAKAGLMLATALGVQVCSAILHVLSDPVIVLIQTEGMRRAC